MSESPSRYGYILRLLSNSHIHVYIMSPPLLLAVAFMFGVPSLMEILAVLLALECWVVLSALIWWGFLRDLMDRHALLRDAFSSAYWMKLALSWTFLADLIVFFLLAGFIAAHFHIPFAFHLHFDTRPEKAWLLGFTWGCMTWTVLTGLGFLMAAFKFIKGFFCRRCDNDNLPRD